MGRAAMRLRRRSRSGRSRPLALLDPCRPLATVVAAGVVRLHTARRVSLPLNGNAWRFTRGHTVKLELVGRDAPAYRPSNGAFSDDVSRLRIGLPTRERR